MGGSIHGNNLKFNLIADFHILKTDQNFLFPGVLDPGYGSFLSLSPLRQLAS